PENATFYHAEGVLYDKAEESEKAMKAYLKAAELDPEYFDTQYNIGALLFNKGDIDTMETLKLIYYRLKMMDKHSRIDIELQNLKRGN
ncbi:unnamed protein product, partial [marine sediment metagenome]